MTEPLDLDALERIRWDTATEQHAWYALIAELRACRAERDFLADQVAGFQEWVATLAGRAERAEAERERAERDANNAMTEYHRISAVRDSWRTRAEKAESALARVEALCDAPARPFQGPMLWREEIRAALRGES